MQNRPKKPRNPMRGELEIVDEDEKTYIVKIVKRLPKGQVYDYDEYMEEIKNKAKKTWNL